MTPLLETPALCFEVPLQEISHHPSSNSFRVSLPFEKKGIDSFDSDILCKLDRGIIDHENPPARATPRLILNDAVVVSTGGLSVIVAQQKAGKSALQQAIIASLIDGNEHLGLTAPTGEGAVIHFDTEQSQFDHYDLVEKACKRSGVDRKPDWLRSYSTLMLTPEERRRALFQEVARAKQIHGTVRGVLLDGYADMVMDVNDLRDCQAFVGELMMSANEQQMFIIGNLHLNPSSDSKSRGHLGSEIERKAEGIITIDRNQESNVATAWLKNARHGYLPKSEGSEFIYSVDDGMHIPASESPKVVAQKKAKGRDSFDEAVTFAEFITPCLPANMATIKRYCHSEERGELQISESTAKRRVGLSHSLEVIKKVGATYHPVDKQVLTDRRKRLYE